MIEMIPIPDDSKCGHCGSKENLQALATRVIIKGLPVDEIRIACKYCYDYSKEFGKLPNVREYGKDKGRK